MTKILVPFDGSDCALRAVRHAASLMQSGAAHQLELLHVANPMPVGTQGVLSQDQFVQRAGEEAEQALRPARRILDDAGIAFQVTSRIGSAASEIANHARDTRCDGIVMGTRGMGPMANAMIGSVATKVVSLVDMPVTLVK